MSAIKPRAKRMTRLQIEGLVDAVWRDNSLHTERFVTQQGKENHRRKWLEVANVLNHLGPEKDWQGWRQAWRDLKNRVRGRDRDIRLGVPKAENAGPIPPLTPLESKVMDVVGSGPIFDEDREPGEVLFINIPTQFPSISTSGPWTPPTRSPRSPASPPAPPSPVSQPPVVTASSFSQTVVATLDAAAQTSPSLCGQSSKRKRRRRGRHFYGRSSMSKYFHSMNGINEGLQEIARSISELAKAGDGIASSISLVAETIKSTKRV